MSLNLRHHLILLTACGAVFFFNLGGARLFDEDEPKNAECGREMYERSDWIVPTFNYELRTDKPIMLYWLMLSSFSVWGVNEFAARLPSACMATVTILCVYQIGLRLFDRTVAIWSGIILASSLMFVVSSRISTPDATLIAFVTLSLWLYVRSLALYSQNSYQTIAQPWPAAYLPSHWTGFASMYAVMGLAVLTKGPVGFLLPCTVIGAYLMCQTGCSPAPTQLSWRRPISSGNEIVCYAAAYFAPSRFFPAFFAMRPWLLIVILAAIALPWYIAVGVQTEGAWLQGFLGNHNLGRFSSAMEGHQGPFFYYAIAILLGFFPWSVFLPITLYLAFSLRSQMQRDHQGLLFLLCWFSVYFVFFSIAQTKLPNYVLPCYPALALLMGWMLVRWQEAELCLPEWAYLWGARSLAIAGLVVIVAFPIVSTLLLPGFHLIGLIGLVPLVAGFVLLRRQNSSDRESILLTLGTTSILFVMLALSGVAPWISQAQESSRIGLTIQKQQAAEIPLATYRYFAPNLPFYAERAVLRYHSIEEILQYWDQHPQGIIAMQDHELAAFQELVNSNVEILDSIPRFLRPQSIVLVKQKPSRIADSNRESRQETLVR